MFCVFQMDPLYMSWCFVLSFRDSLLFWRVRPSWPLLVGVCFSLSPSITPSQLLLLPEKETVRFRTAKSCDAQIRFMKSVAVEDPSVEAAFRGQENTETRRVWKVKEEAVVRTNANSCANYKNIETLMWKKNRESATE